MARLTERQHDVLDLVARGLTNREIARVLGISTATVKSHVLAILRALDADSRTEAAKLACANDAGARNTALAQRPAMAVLRFDSEPGDPTARVFAAGLADDIIGLLCKWRWFPVIARSTSFFYGSDRTAAELRKLTGAAYLFGGSVARHGERLRVTTRLDDARSEECLWADRFDMSAGDLFDFQDEVAAAVVARAYPKIVEAEGRRERRTGALSAWRCAHEGWLLVDIDTPRRSSIERSLELFERASRSDHGYVLPVFGKGMALFERVFNQWGERITDDADRIRRCAERALEIDATDASGWALAGRAALAVGNASEGIEVLARATALNPCHARAHTWLGLARVCEGDRTGFSNLELAERLSPRNGHQATIGMAHFAVGEYEQAAACCREALEVNSYGLAYSFLCAALALSGDEAGARVALGQLLEREPGFTLANWLRMVPRGTHDVGDRLLEGLRRAGLRQ